MGLEQYPKLNIETYRVQIPMNSDIIDTKKHICEDIFGIRCALSMYNDRTTFNDCMAKVHDGVIGSQQDLEALSTEEIVLFMSILAGYSAANLVPVLNNIIQGVMTTVVKYVKDVRQAVIDAQCIDTATQTVQTPQTPDTYAQLTAINPDLSETADIRVVMERLRELKFEQGKIPADKTNDTYSFAIIRPKKYANEKHKWLAENLQNYINALNFHALALQHNTIIQLLLARTSLRITEYSISESDEILIQSIVRVKNARALVRGEKPDFTQ